MTPTALQLFRFSAVTWNMHRIHYDREWAAHEGHAGLLVHSHLHAANALRCVTDGLGSEWEVFRFQYRVVRPATEGTTLSVEAIVIEASSDGNDLSLAIREYDGDGNDCLTGTVQARRRQGS